MRRLVVGIALVLTISVPVSASDFGTPEEAVRAYLEGVAAADIERVLETTATDEMAEGYRFDQQVERMRAFSPVTPGPVHSPFFRDVQRRTWTGELLWRTRMLAYSLLAPDVLGQALEGSTLPDVDEAWAAGLIAALDESRLSDLAVLDVAVPLPQLHESSRHRENLARNALIHGADESTERVALFEFEGDTYAVGFILMRYGDDWRVSHQSSPLSGLPAFGTAQPITIEEFTELTTE